MLKLTQMRLQPLVLISIVVLLTFFLSGLFAPWLAPYDLEQMDLMARLNKPFENFGGFVHKCG